MTVKVDDLERGSERGELRKNVGGLTYGFDFILFDNNPSVLTDSTLGVHGDDHGIVYYRHRVAAALRLHFSPTLCSASAKLSEFDFPD